MGRWHLEWIRWKVGNSVWCVLRETQAVGANSRSVPSTSMLEGVTLNSRIVVRISNRNVTFTRKSVANLLYLTPSWWRFLWGSCVLCEAWGLLEYISFLTAEDTTVILFYLMAVQLLIVYSLDKGEYFIVMLQFHQGIVSLYSKLMLFIYNITKLKCCRLYHDNPTSKLWLNLRRNFSNKIISYQKLLVKIYM